MPREENDEAHEDRRGITIVPGATDDRNVIQRAVADNDGVLVVLVPRGVHGYASGTAQAVLDYIEPGRLVFSCGWHITRDVQDLYTWKLKALVNVGGRLGPARLLGRPRRQGRGNPSHPRQRHPMTVVRGSNLEEGTSQGLPVWSRHVGDLVLRSDITRRVDFAPFMVRALGNDDLVREAPAIVTSQGPSALAHA